VSDYDNFEFRSPVNPWSVQPEHRADFDKLKTMDVELRAGQIIYIPAYWWCSMQFPMTADLTTLCCFKYRTYMNTVSIMDKLSMWMLQQQNVKRDAIEKKITGYASAPIASAPIASAPIASAPIASASIASEPIASEPIASVTALDV
jgi:hypothetical protein